MQTTKRASEEREALQAREAALKFLQGQGQRIERTKGQRKPTSAEAAIIARAKAQSAPRADNTLRLHARRIAKADQGANAPLRRDNPPHSDLPQGWREVRDPASGQSYYWDEDNGTTSWEKPTSCTVVGRTSASASSSVANPNAQAKTTATTAVSADEDDLPPPWVQGFDPQHGCVYYFNYLTKESSWIHPRANASEIDFATLQSKRVHKTAGEAKQASVSARESSSVTLRPKRVRETVDEPKQTLAPAQARAPAPAPANARLSAPLPNPVSALKAKKQGISGSPPEKRPRTH